MGCLAVVLRKVVIVLLPVVLAGSLVALGQRYEASAFSAANMPAAPSSEGLLTGDEVTRYRRDGFLFKRGLVSGEDLVRLKRAVEEVANEFFWTDLVFGKFYKKVAMQAWKTKNDIARFALESNLPSISAQLLLLRHKDEAATEDSSSSPPPSIRILKDAIFAHVGTSGAGCGFHVDDKGFWPSEQSNGVTFWIALTPVRAAQGGGIRVANASHAAEWAGECRDAIKDNTQTCYMEKLHPECNEKLQRVSVTHDFEPGDALLWDRYLFHRGEPFHVEMDERKLRYTIRYVPEGATAAGFHHPSVETGALLRGPHYPQVWPKTIPEEVDGFASFGNSFLARLLPIF